MATPPRQCLERSADDAAPAAAKSLQPLEAHIQWLHLENARSTSDGEDCGLVFDVYGVERWRGAVWGEVYPAKEGAKLAELVMFDDRGTFWRSLHEPEALMAIAEVPERLTAQTAALRRIRKLPEIVSLCRSHTCDVTASGFPAKGCVPSSEDPTACAWHVDVSIIHERMQRYATFHVQSDGTILVSDPMAPAPPLSLEAWRRQ